MEELGTDVFYHNDRCRTSLELDHPQQLLDSIWLDLLHRQAVTEHVDNLFAVGLRKI